MVSDDVYIFVLFFVFVVNKFHVRGTGVAELV